MTPYPITLDTVTTDPRTGTLTLGVQHDPQTHESRSFDPGRVTLLFTMTTPGASDGLDGDPQPILVVWGGNRTHPMARVALRDGLVATGWEPFASTLENAR